MGQFEGIPSKVNRAFILTQGVLKPELHLLDVDFIQSKVAVVGDKKTSEEQKQKYLVVQSKQGRVTEFKKQMKAVCGGRTLQQIIDDGPETVEAKAKEDYNTRKAKSDTRNNNEINRSKKTNRKTT